MHCLKLLQLHLFFLGQLGILLLFLLWCRLGGQDSVCFLSIHHLNLPVLVVFYLHGIGVGRALSCLLRLLFGFHLAQRLPQVQYWLFSNLLTRANRSRLLLGLSLWPLLRLHPQPLRFVRFICLLIHGCCLPNEDRICMPIFDIIVPPSPPGVVLCLGCLFHFIAGVRFLLLVVALHGRRLGRQTNRFSEGVQSPLSIALIGKHNIP
mmetsp:Transcript_20098/g.31432  ORF Transcript_20098/g.31432 Transcript_20098/m.31432 type:complete len:207 (-) Transcript_20098:561-1181(-)